MRVAVTVPLISAILLLLLTLAVAAAHGADRGEEDPEVTACKQQCVRQRQFGAAERRYCVAPCDEYGRMKKREEEEGPEKKRDRCLHECRAGPRKPGCERSCLDEYERATRGGGRPRDTTRRTPWRAGGFVAGGSWAPRPSSTVFSLFLLVRVRVDRA